MIKLISHKFKRDYDLNSERLLTSNLTREFIIQSIVITGLKTTLEDNEKKYIGLFNKIKLKKNILKKQKKLKFKTKLNNHMFAVIRKKLLNSFFLKLYIVGKTSTRFLSKKLFLKINTSKKAFKFVPFHLKNRKHESQKIKCSKFKFNDLITNLNSNQFNNDNLLADFNQENSDLIDMDLKEFSEDRTEFNLNNFKFKYEL